ncbi:methionine--tRNA ligase [Infirmifilum sp. NZ]|uniref:methionine--tRNA ligase n=1 Tax=Infirmifilum sp. NZ TaxID=2926850 RepID=UPI00279C9A79|nr:methionine--tRNA ligase [Infirmifilum sp. NZ]UNQ73693.1 methionine--tRNA ligase [Infirmifilum sp. NZ]
MTGKAFYVTTPIYYPNDVPHIGHAYTTVLADVLARWYRLNGYDVFFLTGTDEHGLKLQRAAEKVGKTPKEFVDSMVPVFKKYWSLLEIEYSRFIRTTDPDHEELVKKVFQRLYEKGYVYKGSYSGWYCVSCEKFYSEGEYVEQGGQKLCPIHGKPLEWVEEETYFLRLSAVQDEVLKIIESGGTVFPEAYAREVVGRIRKEGLKDVSVARPKTRVYWGVELPFDRDFVAYVWIDALLNYLTGIGFMRDDDSFQKYWPEAHHIIGKDILWFHSAIWFSVLRMLGLDPPKRLIVHAYIVNRGLKMGKSTGNVVMIDDLLERYKSADAVRYLLMRLLNLEKDVEFDQSLLDSIYNGELADTYGNLVRRAGVLALRKLGGRVPRADPDPGLAELASSTIKRVAELIAEVKVSEALTATFDLLREANSYMNRTEPWALDDPTRPLYNTLEALRVATNLLYPVMPVTSELVSRAFGFQLFPPAELAFGQVEEYRVAEAPILFQKVK